jgi:hypothetical protein
VDSVITSNAGSLLVGYYRDDTFGKIASDSYFEIGMPEGYDIGDDDQYDSLTLVMRYNGYFWGDTTRSQKISVHQLSENIRVNEEGKISSKTSFAFNSTPIGSLMYAPRPKSTLDTLSIKLNDALGVDLFTKLRDHSDVFTDDESFVNYFHGLVLAASDAYEGAIIGFDDDAKIVLHTTRRGLTTETIAYEFGLINAAKQFNNIKHDFSSTSLAPLVKQRYALPSDKSNGVSFIHAGIGLAVRVDFPSLQELQLLGRGLILNAQLSFSTNDDNKSDLPDELLVYESDRLNGKNSLVQNSSSTLTYDELYHEQTAYICDITKYLQNELADSYIDPDKGLLVTLPDADFTAGFSRAIINAQNRNTKLKIYYLSY